MREGPSSSSVGRGREPGSGGRSRGGPRSSAGLGSPGARRGDSAIARFADGAGLALDGLLAWKRGNLDLAEEFLEEARVEATGHGPQSAVNDAIRWWIAEILVEQGKLHEAEPYFASLSHHTNVGQAPGDLHAELGETEKARRRTSGS